MKVGVWRWHQLVSPSVPVGAEDLTLFALMPIKWMLEAAPIILSSISSATSKTDRYFDLRWSLTAE